MYCLWWKLHSVTVMVNALQWYPFGAVTVVGGCFAAIGRCCKHVYFLAFRDVVQLTLGTIRALYDGCGIVDGGWVTYRSLNFARSAVFDRHVFS